MRSEEEPDRETVPVSVPRLSGAAILLILFGGAGAVCVEFGGPAAFEFDGPSMEPTLVDGDRFVVERYGLWLGLTPLARWGEPEQGDIVVLVSPWDQVHIVKRVVAVAGQHVVVDGDGNVSIDGRVTRERLGPCSDFPELRFPLADARDVHADQGCTLYEETLVGRRHRIVDSGHGARPTDVIVPDGHVFVMGDHRDRSNDSTNPFIGPVPLENIVGGYLATYWEGGS